MRWRRLLILSLGLNLLLAAAGFFAYRTVSIQRDNAMAQAQVNRSAVPKTSVVVRRQFFSWQELESEDYRKYIDNLREIGCPDRTIRDIIVADVNDLYSQRRATEIITPEQQWWRTEADTNVLIAAQAKFAQLENERRVLLTSLLGPGWEETAGVLMPRPPAKPPLDGPVLGVLPEDVKDAVQALAAHERELTRAHTLARRSEGKEADPAELARIRQQSRQELARLLTPDQLEEYQLRYSQAAISLRGDLGKLKYFNTSPEEFRNVFRAVNLFDEQLQLLAGKDDAGSMAQRKALEQQRETALRTTLGKERYEDFQLLHDPAYRQAFALATDGKSPETAQTLYEILQTASAEQQRILSATNLAASERGVLLKQIELEQLKAQAQALGQDVPQEPPPAPTRMIGHVVRQGDNLGQLALIYGVGLNAIYQANPNVDFQRLRPGDTILVPRPP